MLVIDCFTAGVASYEVVCLTFTGGSRVLEIICRLELASIGNINENNRLFFLLMRH